MIPKHDFELIRKGFQEGKTQEQICEDLIVDRKARGITRGIKDVSHTVSKLSKTSAKYVGYVKSLKTYYRKEEILKRIMDVRGVVRKVALKVFKYLETVSGMSDEPLDSGSPYASKYVRIDKGLSVGDSRVYYVFYDEESPTFDEDGGMGPDDMIPYVDYIPQFWRTSKEAPIFYKEVLEDMPAFDELETHFFEYLCNSEAFILTRLNSENLTFLGLAVYDKP